MKNKFTILFTLIAFFVCQISRANVDTTKCTWKPNLAFATWDSCKTGNKGSLNGYLVIKGGSCLKYAWKVNGNAAGSAYIMNYPITANGTYTICVKVTDTCNKCDTTLCATKSISCFASRCNWKSKSPNIGNWDTCGGSKGINSINSYISFSNKSCLKYAWSVNGNAISGNQYYANYTVTANGSYQMCVKVTDTCNKCDTTYCSTHNITCFSGGCNWGPQNVGFAVWDTCVGSGGRNSINGNISVKGSCLKYSWSVNGVVKSDHYSFHYPVTANGTYVLCVKVTDTCNKCDTTFCSTRTISCFGGKCNWKLRAPAFGNSDSCSGSNTGSSINSYISFKNKNCFKYQWSVNGKAIPGNLYYVNYPVTANGSYQLCVKVIDTCDKCDTTYCSTHTFTCFGNKCNWKSRTPYMYGWDTCKGTGYRNSVNAYVSFQNANASCFKYYWTVNGVYAGNKNIAGYTITKNGTYYMCVKVTDTCNNCDTTMCVTKTISCFPSCNWKGKSPYYTVWDTCKGSGSSNSLNGYISLNNRNCLKYQWTVNGVVKGGNSYYFNYPVSSNGTYYICVKVTDTCTKCDTTFCQSRTISCFASKCNFKGRGLYFSAWDSCTGSTTSLNGYIGFTSRNCLKYQWTLAGVNVGTGYSVRTPIYKNGTYVLCVKITDTCNRCDTTVCKTFNINCRRLSTDHITSGAELKLYPNPVNDMLGIDWSGEDCKYVILSAMGSIVREGTLSQGNNQVKVGELTEGVYFVQVRADAGLLTRKLVIRR